MRGFRFRSGLFSEVSEGRDALFYQSQFAASPLASIVYVGQVCKEK